MNKEIVASKVPTMSTPTTPIQRDSSMRELPEVQPPGSRPAQTLRSQSGPLPKLCGETRAILDSVRDLHPLLDECTWLAGAYSSEPVARSKPMRDLLVEACRIASSKASVLIEGESGTGKELVARLIHFASARTSKPFVRVNCAALSESLIESELFGHERGAFTGAAETRIGRFELADGGTLLLDEIGELSVKLQAKLLRVLEEEEFERVGGTATLRVDTRVLATTNRSLEQEMQRGEFRRDLYYRLNVVRMCIPPLRERRDDIPALVAYFIRKYGPEAQVPIRSVSDATLELLMAYDWPGNVRQLRNVIHSGCIHATGEEIRPDDLPPLESPPPSVAAFRGQTLEEIERHVILHTLRELGGNKTAAAARLGVTPRTLLNKMNHYRALGAA